MCLGPAVHHGKWQKQHRIWKSLLGLYVCVCKKESCKCVPSRSASVCASLSGRHDGHASWPQVQSGWKALDGSTLRDKPQLKEKRERDHQLPLKPHTPTHTSNMHCAFLPSDINLTYIHYKLGQELGGRAMWRMNGIMIKNCSCVHWHGLHLPSQRLQTSATYLQQHVYVTYVFFSQGRIVYDGKTNFSGKCSYHCELRLMSHAQNILLTLIFQHSVMCPSSHTFWHQQTQSLAQNHLTWMLRDAK